MSASVSIVVAGIILVGGVALSPLVFPRSPGDAAGRRRAAAGGVPLIYWRPGCSYCLRLRIALGTLGRRAVWVNVSRDPEASARVRAANGGDETVPTVFVGEESWTNPSPRRVRQQLRK
jgi:mycoredoxin